MQLKTIIVLTLFAAVSAHGQFSSFGLKAGPVIADQHWAYAPQLGISTDYINPIWGIDVGSFCEILKSGNFSLQAEIHYVQKGRTLRVNVTAPANNPQGYIDLGMQDVKERFSYLSFPVFAKFYLDLEPLKPYVALGPSLEYLISHPPSDFYEQFKKAEFAILVSAGAEVDLGITPRLLVEVKYTHSLTNSFKSENLKVTNRSLAILLGAMF